MTASHVIRTRTGIAALATALLLFGNQALAQDPHIDVVVEEQDGGFKLVFENSACEDRPDEKGCVEAKRGSAPIISWALKDGSREAWMFTRLQFSPDGVHWGDPAHPLQDCTMEDFKLAPEDAQSGAASTARVIADGARLQIKDDNRNLCRTHYRLFAAPRNGGAEIDSDPIIDNRGGGRN